MFLSPQQKQQCQAFHQYFDNKLTNYSPTQWGCIPWHIQAETSNETENSHLLTIQCPLPRLTNITKSGTQEENTEEDDNIRSSITQQHKLSFPTYTRYRLWHATELSTSAKESNTNHSERRPLSYTERHDYFLRLTSVYPDFFDHVLHDHDPTEPTASSCTFRSLLNTFSFTLQTMQIPFQVAIDPFGNVVLRGALPYGYSPLRWHVDHMIPFSRGGECESHNFLVLQADTNIIKGTHTLGEWLHGSHRGSPKNYWSSANPYGFLYDCEKTLRMNASRRRLLQYAVYWYPPTTRTYGMSLPLFLALVYFAQDVLRRVPFLERCMGTHLLGMFFYAGIQRQMEGGVHGTPWFLWQHIMALLPSPLSSSSSSTSVVKSRSSSSSSSFSFGLSSSCFFSSFTSSSNGVCPSPLKTICLILLFDVFTSSGMSPSSGAELTLLNHVQSKLREEKDNDIQRNNHKDYSRFNAPTTDYQTTETQPKTDKTKSCIGCKNASTFFVVHKWESSRVISELPASCCYQQPIMALCCDTYCNGCAFLESNLRKGHLLCHPTKTNWDNRNESTFSPPKQVVITNVRIRVPWESIAYISQASIYFKEEEEKKPSDINASMAYGTKEQSSTVTSTVANDSVGTQKNPKDKAITTKSSSDKMAQRIQYYLRFIFLYIRKRPLQMFLRLFALTGCLVVFFWVV